MVAQWTRVLQSQAAYRKKQKNFRVRQLGCGGHQKKKKKKEISLPPLPFAGPVTGLSLAKGQGSDLMLDSYL